MRKILLVGNPNVGKSVIFFRLTGISVISSNYPGTTVEYKRGFTKIDSEEFEIIDTPGTYSLEPTSLAEEITVKLIKEGDIIINVVDATNLERNLNLTLQLIQKDIPVIIALNLFDEAKHLGIKIDVEKLEKILGIPVVPTVAITGEGIKELTRRIKEAKTKTYKYREEDRWSEIGKIIKNIQNITHRHHSFFENLQDLTIKPLTGIPIAFLVLIMSFYITRFLGETITTYFLDPLYKNFYEPNIIKFIKSFNINSLENILLSKNPSAMEGFGILTTGIYIPFVVVFPYLLSFYFILSLLEDIGYLPRLAVLLDVFLHRIGLHGYGIVPLTLGFGCKVPAILSTRILESKREKIIATVLTLLIAPCMPQSAMIISLLSRYGIKYLIITFGVISGVGILSSYFLNKFLRGETPELFIEIPPLRNIRIEILIQKLLMRLKNFIYEAIPLIIFGIFIVNLTEITGIVNILSKLLGNTVVKILGLPEEVTPIILFGFLRKDVSIALLSPFNLTKEQIAVASIFLTLYLPCVSTFFIILKENGIIQTIKIIILMFLTGVIISSLLNLFLHLF